MITLPFEFYTMQKNMRRSRDELDSLRLRLLKKQLQHCYEKVPFYQKCFRERGLHPDRLNSLRDLEQYPIISKEDVRKDYTQFINRHVAVEQCYKSHTSGSTGEPSWTYYDRPYWIRKKYLSKLRSRLACGMHFGECVALFECAPVSILTQHNSFLHSNNPVLRIKYFSIFEELEKVLFGLRTFQARNFYGPPSYFFELTQKCQPTDKAFRKLKRIFTSSEYIEDTVRKNIESFFNVPVFDIYGSIEVKEVAWECPYHDGYHINEDEVICEIVKDPSGAHSHEPGMIVVTDLRNRVMPLIRYNLYDFGILVPGTCQCGQTFAKMKPYSGRASDYVELPNGKRLSPYLFTTSVEDIKGLLQYQLIQYRPNAIRARIITHNEKRDEVAREVTERIRHITAQALSVEVDFCSKIEREKNGKYKVIKRMLENKNE